MAGYTWEQNHADAQALADMLWTIWTLPAAGGRPHPRRLLRRRRGPGGGVRRARGRRGRALLPQRGAARAAAGDHRALCGEGAGRAGARAASSSPPSASAPRGRRRWASCTSVVAAEALDATVDAIVADAGGQRPGGGAGLQAAGAGRRRAADRRRAARRHRAPHRRHPRQRRGPRRRAGLPRQARAGMEARPGRSTCRSWSRWPPRWAGPAACACTPWSSSPAPPAGWAGCRCPRACSCCSTRWCWGASFLMFVVEFVADKIPGVDTLWDARAHAASASPPARRWRPASSAATRPTWAAVAALLGGTLAATAHTAKATTRAAVNTSPEPFSNIGLSLAGRRWRCRRMLWLAWEHPLCCSSRCWRRWRCWWRWC